MTDTLRPDLHYGNMYKDDKYSLMRLKMCGEIIKKRIRAKAKILDIGCYTASILDFLPKGIIYYGIEFDEQASEVAGRKGASILKIDLDNANLEIEDRFDIIIASEVLEHLKRPKQMLKDIKRLLKDDGAAIISLPNENTVYHRLMSLFGIGIDLCTFEEFKHLHLPTIRQSENFLKQEFKIERKLYYINPGAKASRVEKISFIFLLIPDIIWKALAQILPGLFARGTIFICTKNLKTGD